MDFVVPCVRKNLDKPKSIFRDNKYVQPSNRRPSVYNRPYKKPTIKIDSDTTYGLSYGPLKSDGCKFNYGVHEKVAAIKKGKFDFDTTYKLSYQLFGKMTRTKMYVPKSCLSINGSHDMNTTHTLSYMDPGYSKAIICEPYRGKVSHRVPMEANTVMKNSYGEFGCVKVRRPAKREVWRTKFKTDYQTTTGLSYQYIGPACRRTRVMRYRPVVSAKIDEDTVYNTSYLVPGRFVEGDDVCVKSL